MSPHNEAHEFLLDEFFAGERDRNAADIQAIITACPECKQRLSDHESLLADLQSAQDEQDEILDLVHAAGTPTPEETDNVQRTLQALSRSESSQPDATLPPLVYFLFGAAALTLMFTMLRRNYSSEEIPMVDPEMYLSAEATWKIQEPQWMEGNLTISWTTEQHSGEHFIARVYDATRPADDAIWSSTNTTESHCLVQAKVLASWPKSLSVEVERWRNGEFAEASPEPLQFSLP